MKTSNIKCLLVDDEIEGLDILEYLLLQYEDIEVVSKVNKAENVLSEIVLRTPDIVFLDINMPNKSGLDLLKDINDANINVKVIFVTAFDQYVFDALKNSAFDYLVKPVDREELTMTLDRYRDNREEEEPLNQVITSLESISKVKIPINYGSLFFSPDELVLFKADGAYTSILLADGSTEFTSLNLGKLQEKLYGRSFFRISRSHLINLKYLYKLDRREKSCIVRVGDDEFSFQVSRNYIGLLDDYFESN